MIQIDEAFELICSRVQPVGFETVALCYAAGRILASPIIADVDSPPHTKSVMDGYAVRAADISRNRSYRVEETIVAGAVPVAAIVSGTVSRIMTGAPLPDGADAVVMVELAAEFEENGVKRVRFNLDAIDSGRHTMPRSASFSAGQTIFSRNKKLRPLDVGLLAEVGAAKLDVRRQLTAAVLPTGNELVDVAEKPEAGQIRNSNGPMLLALLDAAGIKATNLGIGRDHPEQLQRLIDAGLEHDLLLLSGGVSAGLLDLVPGLLKAAGVEQVFHQVKIKPGKPIWFGIHSRDGKPKCVFGLPGNPVSSLVGFELFVKAAIRRMNGHSDVRPETVLAELSQSHQARGDRPTWWPGRWVESDLAMRRVQPLRWLGSSDLRPLGQADVLIHFPADRDEFPAGSQVPVLAIG